MDRIVKKPDCEICRSLSQHKDRPPPCSLCLPPLWPINHQAVRIWQLVQDQRIWVSGGMGSPIPVALMHEPVWKLIDEYKVEDSMRIKTFEKVLRIFHFIRGIEDKDRKIKEASMKK